MDAETAHRMTISLLKTGCGPKNGFTHKSLETTVFGKTFSNPLGLAAGFDKEAEVPGAMLDMGFGFVEVGTVTPRAQDGNPKPRVFRDPHSKSVINRMGFPGSGIEVFRKNIEAFRRKRQGIVGINIGINKDASSPLDDYRQGMSLSPLADYIVINVSSPNTAGLRNLQAREHLEKILSGVSDLRDPKVPLLLKIAPDLEPEQKSDIAAVALAQKIDGLIVSNTTVTRPDALAAHLREEKGGLSGALLTGLSTRMIADMYALTSGRIPIIGAGGVSSSLDAYEKIRAGASLVQVYTALVFEGPALIPRILQGLAEHLQKDGYTSVSQAVGSGQAPLKKVV